ncbi:MAG TPA: hypothetical protein VF783_18990, partial [Terriglobales bacterium]
MLWDSGIAHFENWLSRARSPAIHVYPEFIYEKHITGTENGRRLDDILQLADIPRPLLGLKEFQRLPVDPRKLLP